VLAEKSEVSREECMETIKAVDELARADAKRLGVMPGFKYLRKMERRDRKWNRGLGLFPGKAAAVASTMEDTRLRVT
jgi:hypothetical protein